MDGNKNDDSFKIADRIRNYHHINTVLTKTIQYNTTNRSKGLPEELETGDGEEYYH